MSAKGRGVPGQSQTPPAAKLGEAVSSISQAQQAEREHKPLVGRPFIRQELSTLVRDGIPAPRLMCGGLLYPAGLHSIAGPPDCGKTFIGYWWALGLLREGATVAVFDEESGPEQTAEKLIALGARADDIDRLHYYPFPDRSWSQGDIAILGATMAGAGHALTIWDSSAAFLARAGYDEDRAADVTKFWANVLTPCARRTHSAVLVIDHDRKNGAASRYARGSGSKLAATDVALKLEAVKPFSREQDGVLRLTITKDRRGFLHRAYRVRVTHSPLAFLFAKADGSVSELPQGAQAKLLTVLNDMPATTAELADKVGLARETVSKALNRLLKAGYADKLDQGNGLAALWMRNARSDL